MEKMNLIDDIMKVKGKNTMTKDVTLLSIRFTVGNVLHFEGRSLPSHLPHQHNEPAVPCTLRVSFPFRTFTATIRRIFWTCLFCPR